MYCDDCVGWTYCVCILCSCTVLTYCVDVCYSYTAHHFMMIHCLHVIYYRTHPYVT